MSSGERQKRSALGVPAPAAVVKGFLGMLPSGAPSQSLLSFAPIIYFDHHSKFILKMDGALPFFFFFWSGFLSVAG